MTNREWLMNELQNMSDEELADEMHDFICGKIECEDIGTNCTVCKLNWLDAEHKEKPKLKEAERVILENIDGEYSYIGKAEFLGEGTGGVLYARSDKNKYYYMGVFNEHIFQFIANEQEYSISELLCNDIDYDDEDESWDEYD